MVATKITDLPVDASPTSDDLVVTVNSPGGTPANRRVTLANLITKGHGLGEGIVQVSGGLFVVVTAPSGLLVGTSDSQTLSNKTLTSPVINTGVSGSAIDTDVALTADSNSLLATQRAVKAYIDALDLVTLDTQAGNYTFVIGDRAKKVESTSATLKTFTVPPNSSVPFLLGTTIGLLQYGAGQLVVAGAGGVFVRSADNALKLRAQYSEAMLWKRATDEWILTGDLTV